VFASTAVDNLLKLSSVKLQKSVCYRTENDAQVARALVIVLEQNLSGRITNCVSWKQIRWPRYECYDHQFAILEC
jgi:hypothetical protein